MNAMDITIAGIFSAGIDEVDSQVIYTPLTLTQSILDTPNVDIAVLKFNKLPEADISLSKINTNLREANLDLKAKSWRELAILYRQVEKFYAVQNRLLEGILLALMFLGILRSPIEIRTRERGSFESL